MSSEKMEQIVIQNCSASQYLTRIPQWAGKAAGLAGARPNRPKKEEKRPARPKARPAPPAGGPQAAFRIHTRQELHRGCGSEMSMAVLRTAVTHSLSQRRQVCWARWKAGHPTYAKLVLCGECTSNIEEMAARSNQPQKCTITVAYLGMQELMWEQLATTFRFWRAHGRIWGDLQSTHLSILCILIKSLLEQMIFMLIKPHLWRTSPQAC